MVQMWREKPYVPLYDKWGNSIGSTRDWQVVPDAFDYVIFKDSNVVKAKNCGEGKVEFSDTDVAQVVVDIFDTYDSLQGGNIFIRRGFYQPQQPIVINK